MACDRSKGEVWVFAEQEDGKLSDVPRELLGKGRELADRLGVPLAAVLMGADVAPLCDELFAAGADRVHLVEDAALRVFRGAAYRPAFVALVKECAPQIVIFGATHMGRDLAPAVASALRCGLTADCTDLRIGDYTDCKTKETFTNVLQQIRPAFGGNIIATIVNPRNWPQMATVREGVMKPLAPQPGRTGEIVRHAAHLDGVEIPVEVLEIVRRHTTVNLKGARIIVAGGAGVGSKENFQQLYALADALGGAVGASRAAVDLGYCEHERQIGQTGVNVHPKLYIAFGVSGFVQHTVGMSGAKTVVSVNTDRNAPVFACSDFGIIADWRQTIDVMIDYLKERKTTK